MATNQTTKPKPHVVDRPKESIVIQIHHRRRGSDGLLQEKSSKSLTVYNVTFDDVFLRIKKALRE